MRYAVWFFRLLFAAWMIPAGVNHFLPIFPQPMGSQPLSQELIRALLDSHLFDLVKAVELIAGVGVLLGYYTPLMLVICLPVSFNVFYWDAPLEGWGSRAAQFGYATLFTNAVLCLAWHKSFQSMFALRSEPANKQLALIGRLLFGGWMLLNGANYLLLSLWAMPAGSEPLALQLMTSLVNSRLLDVAMAMQLVFGALILAGVCVPAALCLLMPISTCALYWALLDQQALHALLALVGFGLNGLLMLAHLLYYRDILQRHALSVAETTVHDGSYDSLFVVTGGRVSRAAFVPALVVVVAATAFFGYFVTGRTAHFCMLVLMYPTFVLLARRLRDMGRPGWLLLPPLALTLLAFATTLDYLSLGGADSLLPWIALVATGGMALWGCLPRPAPSSSP